MNKKVEIYGAAYLNGELISYDGEVTENQIKEILNSKTFNWVSGNELTACATDNEALEENECDFLLIIDKEKFEYLTPANLRITLDSRLYDGNFPAHFF